MIPLDSMAHLPAFSMASALRRWDSHYS